MEQIKRSVVITGASTGIGATTALELASQGFQVFAGVRKPEDGEALKKMNPDIVPLILDVTNEIHILQSVKVVQQKLGNEGLWGLVNNAGIVVAGPLEFIPLAELRKQIEVNVIGQVAITQAFLPLIRKARGRIINIGSVSGRSSIPITGAYSASKFALTAITDAMRLELKPWGIEVCSVEPGAIKTSIWVKSSSAAEKTINSLPAIVQELYGKVLLETQRMVKRIEENATPPEKVAAAIAHALTAKTPKTRYLVGKNTRAQLALELLPHRLRDKILIKAMSNL
ncbi:MAG: SDR family oxidoreductase [Oligoflexia bacterium]|nr:SDR family oxidoreductase [Oligoflexia bacterium]